ncbi:MAG: hypothetical protein ACRD5E_08605 [Nitrososphaeraceae archaeon]
MQLLVMTKTAGAHKVQVGTSKIRLELVDVIKFENILKERIEELNIKLKESNRFPHMQT